MTQTPPPPPPPPEGRPPDGPPSGGSAAGSHLDPDPVGSGQIRTRDRTPLSRVRSPYAIWVALLSVAIFVSPNLALLAIGGMEAAEVMERPSTGQLVFSLAVTVVFQIAIFLLAMLPLLIAGRPYRRLLGPTRGTAVMWAIGIGAGVATSVVALSVNAGLAILLEAEDPVEQQILQDALAGGVPLLLAVMIAVIVAPITEEVLFRGVLFRALGDRFGVWVGAIVSSAVFALIHFEILFSQPIALAGLFTVGLLLAFAYHLTGSLLVPILGHAVFNAVSVTLAILVDRLGLDELEQVAVMLRPVAAGLRAALLG